MMTKMASNRGRKTRWKEKAAKGKNEDDERMAKREREHVKQAATTTSIVMMIMFGAVEWVP